MKFSLFVLALLAGAAAASSGEFAYTAIAVFAGNEVEPSIAGTVRLSQDSDNMDYTTVTVAVSGIQNNGTLSLNINQWGNISSFTSAGPIIKAIGLWNATTGSVVGQQNTYNVSLFGSASVIGRTVSLSAANGKVLAQAVIGIDVNSPADTKDVEVFRTSCVFTGIGSVFGNASIVFTPEFNGSSVYAWVYGSNLTLDAHAIHIHEWADITNLNNTGEHFNPFNQQHGIPPFMPRQAGDLGNIYFVDGASLKYKYENNTLLWMDNHFYLNQSFIGRTVVIHTQEDNCKTFGSRLSACVIGVAADSETDNANFDVEAWAGVNTTQDISGCSVVTQTTGVLTTSAPVQTTSVQTTVVQTTGEKTTTGKIETTSVQTTVAQTTVAQTTSAPVQTTEVQTTVAQTTVAQTTGEKTTTGKIETTGLQTTLVQTTSAVPSNATTGTQTTVVQTTSVVHTNSTTDVQTTLVQTTMSKPTNMTSGVQTTEVQTTMSKPTNMTSGVQTTEVQTTMSKPTNATTGVQTTGVQAYNFSSTTASNATTGYFNLSGTTAILTGAPVGTTGSATAVAVSFQLAVVAVCALFMF